MSKKAQKPKTKRITLDLDTDIYNKLEKRAEKWSGREARKLSDIKPFSVQVESYSDEPDYPERLVLQNLILYTNHEVVECMRELARIKGTSFESVVQSMVYVRLEEELKKELTSTHRLGKSCSGYLAKKYDIELPKLH